MGNLKSLHSFWVYLAKNRRYAAYVSEDDINVFTTRAVNEGLSFLTTTLPLLGKSIDRFHSTTEWNPPAQFELDTRIGEEHSAILPGSTQTIMVVGAIPLFLGKAFRAALEGDSLAVDCIRQLSYVFYKLDVPYDSLLVEQMSDQFERTDQELPLEFDAEDKNLRDHLSCMKRLISRILCNLNPLDIRPCHGSGATACRTKNEDKWHTLRYFSKLDAVYSYPEYFFFSMTHLLDEYERLVDSEVGVPRARVVFVPKDSRGPRVISCEPAELLFIQQGLMRSLYRHLESHPLTTGQINFSDQTINRDLARRGSLGEDFVTIDLNEASDRVSLALVRSVFPSDWVEALEACRSDETELPNGKVVKLRKFAPMGSSCCFPVEALVFWASAQATAQRNGLKRLACYVYGDDIIVENSFSKSMMEGLELIGLKINREKSFFSGPFRESCGGDYHLGVDVTPVRVRKLLEKSHTTVFVGADLCNSLVAKFGYDSVGSLLDLIEDVVDYTYPRSDVPYPGVILTPPRASNDAFFKKRFNKSLQRSEYRILQERVGALACRQPDWNELLKKELSRESLKYSTRGLLYQKIGKPLEPGEYADDHTVRQQWSWIWLG